MKKATITRSGLEGEWSRIAKALQDAASFDIGGYATGWMIEPSEVIEQFFAIGEAQPATGHASKLAQTSPPLPRALLHEWRGAAIT